MHCWNFCASLTHDARFQLLTPEGDRFGPADLTIAQVVALASGLNDHRYGLPAHSPAAAIVAAAYAPPSEQRIVGEA